MFQVFNMGHRLEIYTDESTAQKIIDISQSFDIKAQIIGHFEKSEYPQLTIKGDFGELHYTP
jgi:phosphoribosylformylglycinamidine cyclo-ligase